MRTKIKWVVGIGVIVLGTGLSKYYLFSSKNTVRPKRGDVTESIYGLGTLVAENIYRAKSGITANVSQFFVQEGQKVNAGDPLFVLDERIIKTPIAGTVTSVAFEKGELVPQQVPIVTVTNLEKMVLEVSLEQQSVLRVKKEQPVQISFENLRNEKIQGHVENVYPRDNQFIVRINTGKWPEGVLTGMTADVSIKVGEKKNVLLIPLKAINSGFVTIVTNRKKEKKAIKIGVVDGEWGEVLEKETQEQITENDELLVR